MNQISCILNLTITLSIIFIVQNLGGDSSLKCIYLKQLSKIAGNTYQFFK